MRTAEVADVLKVYLATNTVPPADLPKLIREIFEVWPQDKMEESGPVPPVPIDETIKGERIVCLEDGEEVVLLKQYLERKFGISPADYIAKWQLPADYPMVSPEYSRKRREIAKNQGLGKKPEPTPAPARGRKKASA